MEKQIATTAMVSFSLDRREQTIMYTNTRALTMFLLFRRMTIQSTVTRTGSCGVFRSRPKVAEVNRAAEKQPDNNGLQLRTIVCERVIKEKMNVKRSISVF